MDSDVYSASVGDPERISVHVVSMGTKEAETTFVELFPDAIRIGQVQHRTVTVPIDSVNLTVQLCLPSNRLFVIMFTRYPPCLSKLFFVLSPTLFRFIIVNCKNPHSLKVGAVVNVR